MVKITDIMLWEAFFPKAQPYKYMSDTWTKAANRLNEMLNTSIIPKTPSGMDEQTDDLQGIPQECP